MANTQDKHLLARSAAIVSAGNIISRVMGLVRDTAIAGVFGASGAVSAYTIAFQVPRTLYEMLVGGMVSSALVPTFGEYADPERREELGQIASLLFTTTALALVVVVLLLALGAPLLTPVLVQFEDPALQTLTSGLLRIVSVGILFLGLSGMVTALAQSLQRFVLPAFATAVFNASIVAFALILGPRRQDVRVLALGMVVGTVLQVALQIPALRGVRLRPRLDLGHPVVRQVLKLYAPVILSLVISSLQVLVDRNLASRTGPSSPTWMALATTLRETPLGLVSMAVSTAILPTLSGLAAREQASSGTHENKHDSGPFCATLGGGLRLVLTLTLPAATGLWVLSRPLIALLYQHGAFTPADTAQTALALRHYVVGMVFAAVDLPLVIALYARKDTLRPALVGVASIVLYLAVALPTYRQWGMVGLIAADNLKQAGHAVMMVWLLGRTVGSLRGQGIGETLLKTGVSSAVMGAAVYGTTVVLGTVLPAGGGTLAWAATVGAGGLVGLLVYLGLCALLRVRELETLRGLVGRIVGRSG